MEVECPILPPCVYCRKNVLYSLEPILQITVNLWPNNAISVRDLDMFGAFEVTYLLHNLQSIRLHLKLRFI